MRNTSTTCLREQIRIGCPARNACLCLLTVAALMGSCADPSHRQVLAEDAPPARIASAAISSDPCAELEAYLLALSTLQCERDDLLVILERLERHLEALPDTDPEVALGAMHHLWKATEAHRDRFDALAVPQSAEAVAAAYAGWLESFGCAIRCLYEYHEYRVACQMEPLYTSEYSQGYEHHDDLAAVHLRRAERSQAAYEATLNTAFAACH